MEAVLTKLAAEVPSLIGLVIVVFAFLRTFGRFATAIETVGLQVSNALSKQAASSKDRAEAELAHADSLDRIAGQVAEVTRDFSLSVVRRSQ